MTADGREKNQIFQDERERPGTPISEQQYSRSSSFNSPARRPTYSDRPKYTNTGPSHIDRPYSPGSEGGIRPVQSYSPPSTTHYERNSGVSPRPQPTSPTGNRSMDEALRRALSPVVPEVVGPTSATYGLTERSSSVSSKTRPARKPVSMSSDFP